MMALYFFDIADGGPELDLVGTECDSLEAVRQSALHALPTIAGEQIAKNGDRMSFSVVARDENGRAIYAATLSFVGFWLVK